ncbi:MAG: heat-inducible transcriptional repressor HrcA [Rhodothermales bacterium]
MSRPPSTYQPRDVRTARLTDRQRSVLRLVVKHFIETAGPVGSRVVSEDAHLGLSPASIRNTMNDLEKLGFLGHPHTSAGRVPTELGYRAFVDELMDVAVLPADERHLIQQQLQILVDDTDELVRESSRLLARLARLLGVVMSPEMKNGILERLDIVPVSSDRVMFVVSVRGGLVKTIVFPYELTMQRDRLDRLVVVLNERLGGLTLDEIRRTVVPRIQDLAEDSAGIVQLMLRRSGDLFADGARHRTIQLEGTTFMLSQPEFADSGTVRQLIEMIDDENGIIQLLEQPGNPSAPEPGPGQARIHIGHTPGDGGCSLSIVTASYLRSNMQGTIGVIGPTRMNYGRAVALVEGMAMLMSRPESIDA